MVKPTNVSEVELLTADERGRTSKLNTRTAGLRPRGKRILGVNSRRAAYLVLVLLTLIPVILLAAYSKSISSSLDRNGCLPDGTFATPGSTSVWSTDQLFSISIIVNGGESWTFRKAKIVDIVWDVCVGRGGQVVMIYTAYHVFSAAIRWIMDSEPVTYQEFGDVAFQTGSLVSLVTWVKALCHIPWPISGSRIFVFLTMALSTLYIAAMPTLYSAMTSYNTSTIPFIFSYSETGEYGASDLLNCGSVVPCLGIVYDAYRTDNSTYDNATTWPDGYAIVNQFDNFANGISSWNYTNYYERYQSAYSTGDTDIASQLCPTSSAGGGEGCVDLSAPLLNITVWNDPPGKPSHWSCGARCFSAEDIGSKTGGGWTPRCITSEVEGQYIWGFSLPLLLLACVLNSVFAIAMYILWTFARRRSRLTVGKEEQKPSMMSAVVEMASQARRQYGDLVETWSSEELAKIVLHGKAGMRNVGGGTASGVDRPTRTSIDGSSTAVSGAGRRSGAKGAEASTDAIPVASDYGDHLR